MMLNQLRGKMCLFTERLLAGLTDQTTPTILIIIGVRRYHSTKRTGCFTLV
jgi:hypothetical protein